MHHSVDWSTLYLGNLDEMDTDEASYSVEDASPLLTTFGAGAGEALSNNIVDVTTHAGRDSVVSSDNSHTRDSVQYDLGNGTVTAKLDAVVALNGTVTFHDGSTFSSVFGVFQADNGDTFMMALDSQPQLASQGIDSVSFSSVYNSNYYGIEQTTKDDVEFVCFGPGTRLDTPLGPRRADQLRPGDYLTTLDCGPQPIRWIGKTRLRFDAGHPGQPVRLAGGALGPGLPRREILLSPNHRVLVETTPQHMLHDPRGALAPAKALTRQPRIRRARGRAAITYFSVLLPVHALIVAEGIAIESLYPGPGSWAALSGSERSAWLRLAASGRITGTPPARLLLSTAEARAGLEAGLVALPPNPPRILPWSVQHRRAPPMRSRLVAV